MWVAHFDGPGNYDDNARAIALDNVGNVYVTGTSSINFPIDNYATIKYNSNGMEQWVAYYDGPPDTYGLALDIAVDEMTNIFVFGWTNDYTGINKDYALVMYDSNGWQQSDISYDSGTDDYASAMAIDYNGHIYVTGDSKSRESLLTTIKYTHETTSINYEGLLYATQPFLYQNYPDPFNSFTQITYHIPGTTKVKLEIYNSLGQRIRTLVNQVQIAGFHSIVWDGKKDSGTPVASGTYLYSITAGNMRQTKTMMLLK
jgi:hypothetical protein